MKIYYNLQKKVIFFWTFCFCFFLFSFTLYGQITNIPDPNFEQALIDLGIDSDGIINGQVLTSDIENVTILNVVNKGIEDLMGIEGFASLEDLDVSNNILNNLDVSSNIQLRELNCSNWGGFANLNITSLDFSNNINLELLYAENLFLLEELNLNNGNNAILTVTLSCELEGEPCLLPLTCVTVDDEAAATNNEPPYDTWYIAADFIYSEDCTLGIANQNKAVFSLYPNPVNDILYIEKETVAINSVKVYDVMGKLLFNTKGNTNEINISKLPKGMFFVKLETAKGIVIRKIIKQ